MKQAVVASNNAHKICEINQILHLPGYEFVALRLLGDFPEPVEDGATFEENARIKARDAYARTGLPVIADDSGLVVDALDGAPGIYSARYAAMEDAERPAAASGVRDSPDAENKRRLLRELAAVGAVTPEQRGARFVCTVVFIDEDGVEHVACGSCEGIIDDHEHGENGFGYDPLFLPDAFGRRRSMAELTSDEKNAISHRGMALRSLQNRCGEEAAYD